MRKLTEYPCVKILLPGDTIPVEVEGFRSIPAPVAAAHDERDALLDAVVSAARDIYGFMENVMADKKSIGEFEVERLLNQMRDALAALDKEGGEDEEAK